MIGAAIGVNGGSIKDAIGYITPGQIASDIYRIVDTMIAMTKDMAGATDAALGDVRPENTSAIIVLQKAEFPARHANAGLCRLCTGKP